MLNHADTVRDLCTLVAGMSDYFETENYVFTHGWLPLAPGVTPLRLAENWREADRDAWHEARWLKWLEIFRSPARLPDKTIVPILWDDLGVPVQYEEDLLEKFAPYLVNCHLHDNDGITDSHQQPGTGTIDWAEVRNTIEEIGYNGWVSYEENAYTPEGYGKRTDRPDRAS